MNRYTFLYFPDNDKQKEFVQKNLKRLVELQTICFPNNSDIITMYQTAPKYGNDDIDYNSINNDEYKQVFERVDRYLSESSECFFALDRDTIIGMCFCYSQTVYRYTNKSKKNLVTYKIIKEKIDYTDFEETTIYPYLGGLCKDRKYSKVGSFLLDNICDFYKNNGLDIIYLTPESVVYRNNFSAYILKNECDLNEEKYYDSCMELIKYYKSQKFTISDDLYEINKCNLDQNKFILNTVMNRKL
jgi:hypothetical protein